MNKRFEADILLETRKYKELVPHTVIIVEEIHEL